MITYCICPVTPVLRREQSSVKVFGCARKVLTLEA